MKIQGVHIVFMVYSVLVVILVLALVFRKPVVSSGIDYEKIQHDYRVSIADVKSKIDSMAKQNEKLFVKLQDLKSSIPDRKKELLQISKEIKKINELYKESNYRDSTDNALIQRLSR
jgi:peptidoglycan hydrolase CwlO-like protein